VQVRADVEARGDLGLEHRPCRRLPGSYFEGQAARRAELGAFLRACRARLAPADVALPDGSASGRRRTPGLRREEIAQLSGVGVTWYTWLGQGRDISASIQVIDALARALLLTGDQHRHLRELAGLPPPEPPVPAADMLPRLQRLVDAQAPCPASVYDEHFDYLVWNQPYAQIRHDPAALPASRRNMLWMMFTDPDNRARMVRWEPAARAVLSQFRAAASRRPDDPRFAELVAALTEASPQFRDWWAEYRVRYFRPATIAVRHPRAGLIQLEMFQLRLVDQPSLVMVIQVPASETDLARVTSLLPTAGRQQQPEPSYVDGASTS
jgi:MmyB-like transcription regulator ligand binding domain/Helix-turn-helix domain